jgi:uncharacterized membrane protein YqjE
MNNHTYGNNEKSLVDVLHEMKGEALAFINTRYELLTAEIKEKMNAWKASIPMLGLAVVFALGTFATFTFTLVSLLATLIGGDYAWTLGALIVCVLYGGLAAALGTTGYKRLTAQSLAPERTIRVLKQDQQWIKEETRAA